MRITDEIAAYIQHMLEQADGAAELQRNELAESIGCVPSQINYVLTSRFTPEQGYLVESRRGGGGYIRIRQVQFQSVTAERMHIINAIGNELAAGAAQAILENLVCHGALTLPQAQLMAAALSDKAYRDIPIPLRDRLRAALCKQLLLAVNK